MQISKSDPAIKQDTYTKYDENKEIDFNSNLNINAKKVAHNEKPLVEDSKTTSKTYSPLLRQLIASSGPILATASAGMTSGYSAILLPQLQMNDSSILISSDEASWIASMAALPMAFGCIIGGIIMERYGRKMAHLILTIPMAIGWILIAVSTNITWLLVGRFLSGFCVGLLGPPASVYIGETSGPKYRGFLLAGVSLAIAIGILLSHLIGTFVSWKLTAIICSVCPLASFVCMLLAPESPSWLLSKGKVEAALKSFKWLRGCDDESSQEFENMVVNQNTSTSVGNYSWTVLKDNIRRSTFLKPLFILLGFFLTMQFAGVNAVSFYSVTIMKDTIGEGVNEYLAMMIIDVVRFIMSIVACVLLRKCGRRPLLMISGVGTVISLITLAIFLYFSARNEALKSIAWLPMTCLIAYICFVSVGIVPLPWCMTGELFPLSLRGLGSGIVSSFNFVCFFAVVKTGPTFFTTIGQEGAFFIYGSCALIGTIFLVFCLPETKDKTLQEIENSFRSSKKLDDEECVLIGREYKKYVIEQEVLSCC